MLRSLTACRHNRDNVDLMRGKQCGKFCQDCLPPCTKIHVLAVCKSGFFIKAMALPTISSVGGALPPAESVNGNRQLESINVPNATSCFRYDTR
jgi:hypothetical protein